MKTFKSYIVEIRELPEKFWYNVHTKQMHNMSGMDEHSDFIERAPHLFGANHISDINPNSTDWHELIHNTLKQGWVRGGVDDQTGGIYLHSHNLDDMHKAVRFTNRYPLKHIQVELNDDPENYKYAHLTSRKDINNFIETKHINKFETYPKEAE